MDFNNNTQCAEVVKQFKNLGDKGNTLRVNVLNRMFELNKEKVVNHKVLLDLINSLSSYSNAIDEEIKDKKEIDNLFLNTLYHHYLLLLIELETYLDYNYNEVLKEIVNK